MSKREAQTHLDLSHLNEDWDSDDLEVNPEEEFEDDEEHLDDAELEKELGDPIPEVKLPITPQVAKVVTPVVTTPVEVMDADLALKQINEWRNNLPRLKEAVQKKIDNLNVQRQKLNEQEAELRSQMDYLNMMVAPVAVMQQPAKRRGRKPKTESQPIVETVIENRTVNIPVQTTPMEETTTVTTPVNTTAEETSRKRPRNENNWKVSIAKALLTLKHPTTGASNTADLHEIVKKVVLPKEQGGMGYKHTSGNQSSLTSNARVQISRLLEDGWVVKNDDKTFTLTNKAIQEISGK